MMPVASAHRWIPPMVLAQLLACLFGFIMHPFSFSPRIELAVPLESPSEFMRDHTHADQPNTSTIYSKIPAYVIVGAQKSGTSALYFGLCEHQNVTCSAYVKEPFFLTNGITEEFVRSSAASSFSVAAAKEFQKQYIEACFNVTKLSEFAWTTSEASTSYFDSDVALDALRLLPVEDVRILVVLRDPLDRAYSLYQHEIRKFMKDDQVDVGDVATFAAAVSSEIDAINECVALDSNTGHAFHRTQGKAAQESTPSFPFAVFYQCIQRARVAMRQQVGLKSPGYLFGSFYFGRYIRWKQAFGRRLRVILYDDLREDPVGTLDRVVEHLGLPPMHWTAAAMSSVRHEYQQGSRYLPYNRSDTHIRAIEDLFEPHTNLLALHLRRCLPWGSASRATCDLFT
eukprot:m.414821 g.414821  ORF g.414821 m.414821 type:complete len:398 (-) comp21275_c1_seq2:1829-3022(-)